MQKHVDIDEPEAAAAPMLPADARPRLGRDDPTQDVAIDTMTEEDVLRGLQKLTPEEPSTSESRLSSPSARRYEKLVGGSEEEDAL